VKRALIKPILLPVLEATGKLRSIVPRMIANRNPDNNICGGDSFDSLIIGAEVIFEMVCYTFLINF